MGKNFLFAAGTALLLSCTAINAGAQSRTTETVKLFNGKNLNGWSLFVEKSDVDPATVFYVKDGMIRVEGEPMGYMYTKLEYDDFKLHVEWRWVGEPTNSGVFLFVQDGEKLWPNAVECQLAAGNAGDFVLLGGSDLAEFQVKDGEKRPDFPVVKKAAESSEKPAGEWNQMDVVCKDGTITVYVNGILQNRGSRSLHKKGHIALQSEGGPLEFRNVSLERAKR